MDSFERQRLLTVLMGVAMTLFVSINLVRSEQWRNRMRLAAISGFALAVVFALFEIAIWLFAGLP